MVISSKPIEPQNIELHDGAWTAAVPSDRNLGVVIDDRLNLDEHISMYKLYKGCQFVKCSCKTFQVSWF